MGGGSIAVRASIPDWLRRADAGHPVGLKARVTHTDHVPSQLNAGAVTATFVFHTTGEAPHPHGDIADIAVAEGFSVSLQAGSMAATGRQFARLGNARQADRLKAIITLTVGLLAVLFNAGPVTSAIVQGAGRWNAAQTSGLETLVTQADRGSVLYNTRPMTGTVNTVTIRRKASKSEGNPAVLT